MLTLKTIAAIFNEMLNHSLNRRGSKLNNIFKKRNISKEKHSYKKNIYESYMLIE